MPATPRLRLIDILVGDRLPATLAVAKTFSARGWERLNVPLLLANIEGRRMHPDATTVLCLTRQNFSKDIDELRARTDLNWLTLRHKFCGAVQMPWMPERLQQQMYHAAQTGPEVEAARTRSVRFFVRFIGALRRKGIDAIMSANTDYWQDEAIREACLETGFPFLVLSREHYITAAKAAVRVERYRGSGFQFRGTAVAVFGAQTCQTMIDAQVCGPARIEITGAPRLDGWRDLPERDSGNLYLLISFARPQYGAVACHRETYATFADFARSCPDPEARFVVKCKNEEDRGFIRQLALEFPSPRVKIVLGAAMMDLLAEARAVIGFNSLALLEALLGPGAICLPNWADAAADPDNQMLRPDDPLAHKCVLFAHTPTDLRQWLEKARSHPPADRTTRLELLRQFFYYPTDTTCSAQVAQFVERFVQS